MERLLSRVLSGSAVGVLLDTTSRLYPIDGIVYIPIADARPLRRRLVWSRTNPNPLLPCLVEVARALGAKLAADTDVGARRPS